MAIKVRAKAPGVYGRYREAGHEFEIQDEKHFSKNWMETVDGKKKSKSKKQEEEESQDSGERSSPDEDVI